MDVDGVRRSWTAVETDWDTTDHRVRSLPEADLYKRVNDEWSYVETLRHLVFVTDAWIRRTVLSATDAYHRLGLPPDGDVDVRPWGIEVAARPTFEEVMTVRADRLATVRAVIADLEPADLSRTCPPNPSPGFPPQTVIPIRFCIELVIGEERAHHGYAVRDLDVLQGEAER